jgi:hypothetical protein
MLLHKYFCDDWFESKFKRYSKTFDNLIWKIKLEKENFFSFPLPPSGPSGPVGLLPFSFPLAHARALSFPLLPRPAREATRRPSSLSPSLCHWQPWPTCRRRPPPLAVQTHVVKTTTAVRAHLLLASWERPTPCPAFKWGHAPDATPLLLLPAPFSLAESHPLRGSIPPESSSASRHGPPHPLPPRLRFRRGELPRASLSPSRCHHAFWSLGANSRAPGSSSPSAMARTPRGPLRDCVLPMDGFAFVPASSQWPCESPMFGVGN